MTPLFFFRSVRTYHGVTVLDGYIYVVAGFDGTECFISVHALRSLLRQHDRPSRGPQRHGRLRRRPPHRYTSERYDASDNQSTVVSDMHEVRNNACAKTPADAVSLPL